MRIGAALLAALACWAAVPGCWAAKAQTDGPGAKGPADIRQQAGRLVLVLPFDNRSGQSNLNWIGDSFPYTLNERPSSAGFLTISRDDRMSAHAHPGLPH